MLKVEVCIKKTFLTETKNHVSNKTKKLFFPGLAKKATDVVNRQHKVQPTDNGNHALAVPPTDMKKAESSRNLSQ